MFSVTESQAFKSEEAKKNFLKSVAIKQWNG